MGCQHDLFSLFFKGNGKLIVFFLPEVMVPGQIENCIQCCADGGVRGSWGGSLEYSIDLQSASIKAYEGTWFQADVTQDLFAMILKDGECDGVCARCTNFLCDEEERHDSVNELGRMYINSIVQVILLNGA
jgi:hypothetical protein